jgi:hypothetical protein
VIGALGFALAGLAIGTRGELAGIAKLDIYHLVLATASALMGFALVSKTASESTPVAALDHSPP